MIAGVDQALAATGQASQRAAGASGGVTVGVGVGTEQGLAGCGHERNLSVVAPSQFTFSSRSPDFVDETAGQSWCAILGLNQ
ncbi:hypothetical protein [Mycobacterium canetti]|uniref:Uncharacterized protein n=2 Tax=Mycobacterium canetti TaxID=78331 RepID=A0ABV1MDH3_9MYCO|nr:hypothetical protein [Mycobacterium canetti]MBA2787313.1 hypothetical protein [Mycobacterium canetti]MBC9076604.1 hypothetical protein [Mycobacterium canetti]CCC45022.1 putative uncharacterized protein mb2678c [Mycobacterium canettii CIPT 140010059]